MDSREAITPNETSMDIRSMTTENVQTETLDSAKCTTGNLHLFMDHMKTCRSHLEWLEQQGKAILEAVEPATQDVWEPLAEHCFLALREMPNTKSVRLIYQLAIRKGIASLLALAKTGKVTVHEAGEYFQSVARELSPPRFGIGSHYCSVEESREMIDSLVPIAQECRDYNMLGMIACRRFPGKDKTAQEMMVKANKNW